MAGYATINNASVVQLFAFSALSVMPLQGCYRGKATSDRGSNGATNKLHSNLFSSNTPPLPQVEEGMTFCRLRTQTRACVFVLRIQREEDLLSVCWWDPPCVCRPVIRGPRGARATTPSSGHTDCSHTTPYEDVSSQSGTLHDQRCAQSWTQMRAFFVCFCFLLWREYAQCHFDLIHPRTPVC